MRSLCSSGDEPGQVTGELELCMQYKYIRVRVPMLLSLSTFEVSHPREQNWDILYRGILYMLDNQWDYANNALSSAIQSFPGNE